MPTWRKIQHLGDIRNLCDHNKDREPKNEEVEELIAGVETVIKTVYQKTTYNKVLLKVWLTEVIENL